MYLVSSDGRNRQLTREQFEQLLSFLDQDREVAGQKYEEIRIRLVKIFCCRGSLTPEDLADETINRVAAKVSQIAAGFEGGYEERIRYFCGVARRVFLESVREKPDPKPVPKPEWTEEKELACECLDKCMEQLIPRNRTLILEYYRREKQAKIDHRKDFAERLGMNLNTLRIRACRIRQKLQRCVFDCMRLNEMN